MDGITRKRPGRPRKLVDVPRTPQQDRDDAQDDLGDGTASSEGSGAQADDGEARQKFDWAGLTAHVMKMHKHGHQITCVWHPEASGLIHTDHLGSIRTEVGPVKYQLSTGEFRDFDC